MRWSFVLAVLAPLAAAPAPAHAGPVTLWACHGPAGAPLPFPHVAAAQHGAVTAVDGGCAAPGGVLRLRFTTATPVPDDYASLRFSTPFGTSLERVLLGRRVTGPTYRARTTISELESLPAPGGIDGVLDRAASGTAVELDLRCETACDADASADFRFAAVTVRDDVPPVLHVGAPPRQVARTFRLALEASDGGLGLAAARATLDGVPVASATFGLARCAELSPVTRRSTCRWPRTARRPRARRSRSTAGRWPTATGGSR